MIVRRAALVFLLMLLLPIQAAWALAGCACAEHAAMAAAMRHHGAHEQVENAAQPGAGCHDVQAGGASCSASAACMNLHAAGLAPFAPSAQGACAAAAGPAIAPALGFVSAVLDPEHRPPISRLA